MRTQFHRFASAAFVLIAAVATATFGNSPTLAQDNKAGAPAQQVDVNKLVGESDQFFATIGAGKVPPNQLLAQWTPEQNRLNQVEAAILNQAPSLLQVKIQRRLGVAGRMLSDGKGSEGADRHFNLAELILNTLNNAGSVPEYQEKLATLWKERADNLVLLGREDRALFYLDKALKAAQASSYKDKLDEATIREQLAGVYFRKEEWQKALDMIQPSLPFLELERARHANFDHEALRMPYWYVAVATSRLGRDARAHFDSFLVEFDKDLTAHARAGAFREAAVNMGELSSKQTDDKRLELLKLGNGFLLRAKQIIDQSNLDEDAPEKVAILRDLGVSYARGGMRVEAEQSFKDAVAVARASKSFGGPNSPALVPVLERFAALYKGPNGLKHAGEPAQLEAEIARIKALHPGAFPPNASKKK